MSTITGHEEIVVFSSEASMDHTFHLLARGPIHDKTNCGRSLDGSGALVPRFVADVAGYHVCESCLRLQHVYGEASALLQEPTPGR